MLRSTMRTCAQNVRAILVQSLWKAFSRFDGASNAYSFVFKFESDDIF